jgi:hypothetical protein
VQERGERKESNGAMLAMAQQFFSGNLRTVKVSFVLMFPRLL